MLDLDKLSMELRCCLVVVELRRLACGAVNHNLWPGVRGSYGGGMRGRGSISSVRHTLPLPRPSPTFHTPPLPSRHHRRARSSIFHASRVSFVSKRLVTRSRVLVRLG